MNYRCAWLALWALCASLMVRAEKGPADLLEADFAGAEALRQNTNLTTLHEVMGLAESASMLDLFLKRSGAAGLSAWTGYAPGDLGDRLKEALNYRCRLLVTGPASAPVFAFAVQFPGERPAAWKAGGAVFTNSSVVIIENGRWAVVQTTNAPARVREWTDKIFADKSEPKDLLTVSAHPDIWPAGLKPALLPKLTGVEWTTTARGDALRSVAALRFATNLNLHLTPWSIPTNSIHDPLVGFSGAQDPAAWLNGDELLKRFALPKAPAQAYLWSVSLSPFLLNGAVSAPEPQAQMDASAKALAESYNSGIQKSLLGQILYNTNDYRLSWTGLPIAVPFLKVAPDPGYLMFGLFPLEGKMKPGPADLFSQVAGRTNLVYYDWEITQGRLTQLRTVSQLRSIINMGGVHPTNAVSEQWMATIESRLGNAIGEMVLAKPNEMTLTRRSPIGLNAMEIVALARWAEPFSSGPRRARRAAPLPPLAPPASP